MSKFGRPPINDVFVRRHIRVSTWIAEHAPRIEVSTAHLYHVIKGEVRPSPAVCEHLPAILGVPLSGLFMPEQLAVPYDGRKGGPRGPRKRVAA